jgi:hypothetical protein
LKLFEEIGRSDAEFHVSNGCRFTWVVGFVLKKISARQQGNNSKINRSWALFFAVQT